MARPTEPGRKHGLRRGVRDRANLELSILHAEIEDKNHNFLRAAAKTKGLSVGAFLDEWISVKREKFEALYKGTDSTVNAQQ